MENYELDLKEFTSSALQKYKSIIVPSLDSGKLDEAKSNLENLVIIFNMLPLYEVCRYHNGIKFMASARQLLDDFKSGRVIIREQYDRFETYLSQLKLSIESGNKF